MPGHEARIGFRFQDLYLLFRVLRATSEALEAAWKDPSLEVDAALKKLPYRFGLEASSLTSHPSGEEEGPLLAWDVLVLGDGKLDYAEVKSGILKKDDRITFWNRIREEWSRDPALSLCPVLVIDPTTVGDTSKWQQLAATAQGYSGPVPISQPEGNVLNVHDLLQEALWYLSGSESNKTPKPLPLEAAVSMLSRFELHQHEANALEKAVSQYMEVIFPGGMTETQKTLLLGWLSERATDEERKLFTVQELLAEIGILKEAISLERGVLKQWRTLWSDLHSTIKDRTRVRVGKTGISVPAAQAQPQVAAALVDINDRTLLILGPGGSGKSCLLTQAVDAAAQEKGNVILHCGADDLLSLEELDELTASVRFRASLLALRNPGHQLCLFVDGLDEPAPELRKRWSQQLVRMTGLNNLQITVSMREADWRLDGNVRKSLASWRRLSMEQWSESLVQDTLAGTAYASLLPPSVLLLLRTPIFLDIFWRTFVERESNDPNTAGAVQTRHQLLAAFWLERLIHGHRYSDRGDVIAKINSVFEEAAKHVGAFPEGKLDTETLQLLLSESVLVREGRLRPGLRFRHPLLRDFALAQWCLSGASPSAVAAKWAAIKGGLERYGALRAMFEALNDPASGCDHPELSLTQVVQALVCTTGSKQVAHILGTNLPMAGLDPASWPHNIQGVLPSYFGRDLLAAARLDANKEWAGTIDRWPDDAAWTDEDFPMEVQRYLETLSKQAKLAPDDLRLKQQSVSAARTLRRLSEVPRFAGAFNKSDRWLKMQSIRYVVPLLPDDATIAWLEREMSLASWRTREFTFEQLIRVAKVDAHRTAGIYRKAVGLSTLEGKPKLDTGSWRGIMGQHAIEWSLGGEDGHRSLLKEHPREFVPVALELAEALWYDQQEDRDESRLATIQFMTQFHPAWASLTNSRSGPAEALGDMIDDLPIYSFWEAIPGDNPYERCLRVIHDCARREFEKSLESFAMQIGPLLRSSRLGTAQTILMDLLLRRPEDPTCVKMIQDCLEDRRIFHISDITYWIEQCLMAVWPKLANQSRRKILENIMSLSGSDRLDGEEEAKHFLARLPSNDLPQQLRVLRPNDTDKQFRPIPRPRARNLDVEPALITPLGADAAEEAVGDWPTNFDRPTLKSFYNTTQRLSAAELPLEDLKASTLEATDACISIIPKLFQHPELLEERSHWWFWNGTTDLLNSYTKLHTNDPSKPRPPNELVEACGALALAVAEKVPTTLKGKLPEEYIWSGAPDTPWTRAVKLANAALLWTDEEKAQHKFLEIIEKGFATGDPLVQLSLSYLVSPWHWFRTPERKELHDKLVWKTPRHASVLAWSLGKTKYYNDLDRARVCRLLLNRGDLDDPDLLAARMGDEIGTMSIHVYGDSPRSAIADITREILNDPSQSPLLATEAAARKFLRHFVLRLKSHAKVMANHVELAADYGDWILKAWRQLRKIRSKRGDTEHIVVQALHWLKKTERTSDRDDLRPWWLGLMPFLREIATEGGRSDCFMLFYMLHSGECNDVATCEEIIKIVESFLGRLAKRIEDESLSLDERNPEQEEHHSWRDTAEFAAETLDSLRRDDCLRTDTLRDQAYRLLTRLASPPFNSAKAAEALHHLQNV